DDVADLTQATMGMRVRMFVRVLMIMCVFMAVRMRMYRAIGVAVLVDVPPPLRPVFVAGHVFLTLHHDINLCCGDAVAQDARSLEFRSDIQRPHGFAQEFGRDAGIDQGAEKHVAADSAETVEVGDSHGYVLPDVCWFRRAMQRKPSS